MIGEHLVEYIAGPDVAGAAVDVTCLVDTVGIAHGRADTESQPEPASATVNLSTRTGEDVMPDFEIGAWVRVTITTALVTSVRFLGRITDLEHMWEEAGEGTPNLVGSQLIAVSAMADLGRRVIGDVPMAQELDGARVARVMTLAGVPLDPLYSDPGTVQVLPRDIDSQPALEVARGTAIDAGGTVWHTRAGEVRYADANHRRGTVAALELDACDILLTPKWRRTTEGLLNKVSIGYGPTPAEGEQPRYVADRPASVAQFGRYELSAATELVALADASAMGNLLLTRNSSPVWVMPDLPLDVKGLGPEATAALLSLDMHSLIDLTGIPAAGTAPTSAALWVEGWAETLVWGDHELTLAVSGYCRTVPAPWWNDLDPALTWDTVDPASTTWDDMTCGGPTVNRGRWDDTPASTRWDQVPPGTTWDTWK